MLLEKLALPLSFVKPPSNRPTYNTENLIDENRLIRNYMLVASIYHTQAIKGNIIHMYTKALFRSLGVNSKFYGNFQQGSLNSPFIFFCTFQLQVHFPSQCRHIYCFLANNFLFNLFIGNNQTVSA